MKTSKKLSPKTKILLSSLGLEGNKKLKKLILKGEDLVGPMSNRIASGLEIFLIQEKKDERVDILLSILEIFLRYKQDKPLGDTPKKTTEIMDKLRVFIDYSSK